MTHPQAAQRRRGLARIARAGVYSWRGLSAAVRHEPAFRQELLLGAAMLPAALALARDWVEAAVLIGSVVGVWIVELLNSAVECVVDRISDEMHPLSGRAKDYGSAAVTLALLGCGGVWAAALWRWWHSPGA